MPPAYGPAASFEEHLAREIGASERLRAKVLVWMLAALIAFFAAMFAVFHDDYAQQFGSGAGFAILGSILVALLAYEVLLLRLIARHAAVGLPAGLRYLNALIETSVPSLIILVAAAQVTPIVVLQSGAVLLYGVFIVLATLLLDYRLAALTGLVAAAQYVALCVLFEGQSGDILADTPLERPPFYLAKGAMLVLSGFAAGFVAQQLKRRVGNAFRTMQERQRVLDAFGQQVSPAIAEELLKAGPEIASRRAEVCVLFMDIREFTRLVGNWPPERIVALQNAVFAEGVEIVSRNRGIINQFLGDGFMATFGVPTSSGRDCANALAAARELVAGVRALAEAGLIPAIKIGIGLHAGQAVTGNIGSAQRQQYSVTGDVVILASRIEQLNKEFGSQVLVSREVLEGAGGIPPEAVPLGPVRVKGRDEPIEIYRLA